MKFDRRAFVLSTASLTAFPWVRRTAIPAASADDITLLFHGDFNVGSFSEYKNYGDNSHMQLGSSGNTPTVSTDRSRTGTKSARIYLNRKTSGNLYRTEATAIGRNKSLEFRRTYWIGFSVYVPSNWIKSSTPEILFQLNYVAPPGEERHGFSPIMAVRVQANSDRWYLTQNYVQTPESQHKPSDRKRAFSKEIGQIAKGDWTDWVIEYRPDWRSRADGGNGVTRIWCDGTCFIDYAGPNCVNSTKGPYIKFGCYKASWKQASKSDTVSERLYYFDEIRVSRPDKGSYATVNSGKTAS